MAGDRCTTYPDWAWRSVRWNYWISTLPVDCVAQGALATAGETLAGFVARATGRDSELWPRDGFFRVGYGPVPLALSK